MNNKPTKLDPPEPRTDEEAIIVCILKDSPLTTDEDYKSIADLIDDEATA